MVRFCIHTTTSKSDINGNRYHYAQITSTKTKKTLLVDTHDESNILAKLRNFGLEWDEIYSTSETINKRNWQQRSKNINLYEHDLTKEMLLALEN